MESIPTKFRVHFSPRMVVCHVCTGWMQPSHRPAPLNWLNLIWLKMCVVGSDDSTFVEWEFSFVTPCDGALSGGSRVTAAVRARMVGVCLHFELSYFELFCCVLWVQQSKGPPFCFGFERSKLVSQKGSVSFADVPLIGNQISGWLLSKY